MTPSVFTFPLSPTYCPYLIWSRSGWTQTKNLFVMTNYYILLLYYTLLYCFFSFFCFSSSIILILRFYNLIITLFILLINTMYFWRKTSTVTQYYVSHFTWHETIMIKIHCIETTDTTVVIYVHTVVSAIYSHKCCYLLHIVLNYTHHIHIYNPAVTTCYPSSTFYHSLKSVFFLQCGNLNQ